MTLSRLTTDEEKNVYYRNWKNQIMIMRLKWKTKEKKLYKLIKKLFVLFVLYVQDFMLFLLTYLFRYEKIYYYSTNPASNFILAS